MNSPDEEAVYSEETRGGRKGKKAVLCLGLLAFLGAAIGIGYIIGRSTMKDNNDSSSVSSSSNKFYGSSAAADAAQGKDYWGSGSGTKSGKAKSSGDYYDEDYYYYEDYYYSKAKSGKAKSGKGNYMKPYMMHGVIPHGLYKDGPEKAWANFVEAAFPTWCINDKEERQYNVETCADGSMNGRYDPLYLTKQRGGEDPALGGYPTDIDTRYPFYFGSPFLGQPCAGGNAHCSLWDADFDPTKDNCAKCGKIVTDSDDGPNGPGHVPPHIGLAALTRAYFDGGFGMIGSWFNYDQNGCRVLPDVLLSMIRHYFPRDADGKASYPPPFTADGGPGASKGETYAYPLEYVNLVGDSCVKEQEKFPTAECYEQHSGGTEADYPPYLKPGHGSPHYCSVEAMDADVNKDYCPYVFFGPNRGKYRHPHIAYAALEVHLAHIVMPETCGPTWDHNDGATYPFTPDNSVSFPQMASVPGYPSDPEQPYTAIEDESRRIFWPGPWGPKAKSVSGEFVVEKVTKEIPPNGLFGEL